MNYNIIEYDEKSVYLPTQAEKKLLRVLSNPEYIDKTIKAKCEIAGVHYLTYYRAMKTKPGFKKALEYLVMESLKYDGTITEVMQSIKKHAFKDPRCHQDRKLLLQLLGVYTERKEVDINNRTMNVNVDLNKMTTDELQQMVKEYAEKL